MQETVKSRNHSLVLFNPLIGHLPGATTPVRVNPGAMAMKAYYTFPNAPALLEPHYQIV